MMRIGEFSDSFLPIVDGVGRVVKAYADTLSSHGEEVYVITPMNDTGFRGNLPYEIVDFVSLKLARKLPWKVGFEFLDPHYEERIKNIELDICHAHSPFFSGNAAYNYAKRHKIPLVGTFHSKYYDDFLKATHSKNLAKIGTDVIVSFYNKCDEVWAVSESAALALREYGYKREIVVAPNGTTVRSLDVSKLKPTIEKYKVNTKIPVFFFAGQINWKKGLRCILESCAILANQGQQFQLILAGQGPDKEDVLKLAEKLGIEKYLTFTGHITDVSELDCLYSLADLFLFPSLYDTSSLVVKEAAGMHTPSIVIKDTGPAESIQDKINGFLTDGTASDLVTIISDYLAMPENRKKEIEENAYKTIPQPWDGQIIEMVLENYSRLIERNKYLRGK